MENSQSIGSFITQIYIKAQINRSPPELTIITGDARNADTQSKVDHRNAAPLLGIEAAEHPGSEADRTSNATAAKYQSSS